MTQDLEELNLENLTPEELQKPENFRAACQQLDLSLKGMAEALRLDSADNMRAYQSGKRPISGPISVCLYYFLRYGPPDWFSDEEGSEDVRDANTQEVYPHQP